MLIGVPKEIKNHEYRVGLVPSSVREFVAHGHDVLVETQAGGGVGFTDEDYEAAGATIAATAQDVFARAEMIVKVKEPQAVERKMLQPGQILYTYLHLAPDPEQTADLVDSGAVCIAYETVTDRLGRLPLLAPMSEVAGRMSIQVGAACLQKSEGGRGVLLGGVPGVPPSDVVVLGGGMVGSNAAMMALGLGANVTILDKNVDTLRRLVGDFGSSIKTVFSTRETVESLVLRADLVIGGVLIPGRRSAQAGHRRHDHEDEARLGRGRCRDRPGWLLRDLQGDDPRGPDLHRRRRRALLRRQHAGRRCPHVDIRAQQRDASIRSGACRQGLQEGVRGTTVSCAKGSMSTRAR